VGNLTWAAAAAGSCQSVNSQHAISWDRAGFRLYDAWNSTGIPSGIEPFEADLYEVQRNRLISGDCRLAGSSLYRFVTGPLKTLSLPEARMASLNKVLSQRALSINK
jgi:hypothetical protein